MSESKREREREREKCEKEKRAKYKSIGKKVSFIVPAKKTKNNCERQ
jgi:hypothetical protein